VVPDVLTKSIMISADFEYLFSLSLTANSAILDSFLNTIQHRAAEMDLAHLPGHTQEP
jgi:hypothetical protein